MSSTGSAPDQGTLTFPALSARTMRFTLGIPSQFAISPDGEHVLFLRARSGTERDGLLWRYDTASGEEVLIADPRSLLTHGEEQVPDAERARRERMRQGSTGITAFSTDRAARSVAVTLSGRVFVMATQADTVVEVPVPAPVVDPRLSPCGRWLAWHSDGSVYVAPSDGSQTAHPLALPDGDAVSWGLSDFVHAEEFHRLRSFWWAPDSTGLLVVRVDESPVQTWHIADPARPERVPTVLRYPAAGTANPVTSLWHIGLDGVRTAVPWDTERFPYLVDVTWADQRPALITVLDRHQRRMRMAAWEPGGTLSVTREITDGAWVDVIPGVPAWWGERLVTVEHDRGTDTRRLLLDGTAVTPPGVQVRAVLDVTDDFVLLAAGEDGREVRIGRAQADGRLEWASPPGAVSTGRYAAGTTVVRTDTLAATMPSVQVMREDGASRPLVVLAVEPPLHPRPRFLSRKNADDPRVAVLLPANRPDGPLPVLLDAYGGPHAQRVLATSRAYLESQWWAEQGYLVVVADGPGTPGSPGWERAMAGQFAEPALRAQVRALEMVGEAFGEQADLSRVGIRGWSFGGYLAALAVLERPDLIHAAIAGAPVTDWAYYDTAYTERYLGLPAGHPGRYAGESLLDRAAGLQRPLLLIHGLADDNVVAAHTLRLSATLLVAGRAHDVLPLSGVTHTAPPEVVAENLLLLQRDFFARCLHP